MSCQLLVLALFSYALLLVRGARPSSNVAVPKGSKGGFFSNTVLGKLIRELKINFSSQLEAVTLEATRPDSNAIPIIDFDLLTNLVNEDYENPDTTAGLLVKISRKFSEVNVYTKLKATYLFHRLLIELKDSAKNAWSEAYRQLSQELDDKTDHNFFDLDSIDDAASKASNVGELQATELARLYSQFIFNSLIYIRVGKKFRSNKPLTSISDRTTAFLEIISSAEEIDQLARKLNVPISNQLADSVLQDIEWAVKTLTKIYQGGELDGSHHLEEKVIPVLKKHDSSFKERIIPSPSSAGKKELPVEEEEQDEEDEENDEKDTTISKQEAEQPREIATEKKEQESIAITATSSQPSPIGAAVDVPPSLKKSILQSVDKLAASATTAAKLRREAAERTTQEMVDKLAHEKSVKETERDEEDDEDEDDEDEDERKPALKAKPAKKGLEQEESQPKKKAAAVKKPPVKKPIKPSPSKSSGKSTSSSSTSNKAKSNSAKKSSKSKPSSTPLGKSKSKK